MIKPAFSTIACPELTLANAAQLAADTGFSGVELRTFGSASTTIACDPAMTDEAKTRGLFSSRGVEILSVATSCRFDEPILPPVLGLVISDTEASVREARRAVDLAVAIEAPLVRVFGFQIPAREGRASAVRRIAKRLGSVVDHAHRTGVRVALENGGSFATAAQVAQVLDAVGSPLLGASYSIAAAREAGEEPRRGIATLAPRLWLARIKDLRNGRPCALGAGDLPAREFVSALAQSGFDGPLVYEWDRLWFPDLAAAAEVLPAAARSLVAWIAEAGGPTGSRPVDSPVRA
ncbi:MAG: sugar phosphate isomerase/epimerase [Phycisphaeraceae bacterium]|nr:sugar phosphate isomerase/epimerase [Phycisphaeraceae bacterium]